jgi:hypothetical protein
MNNIIFYFWYYGGFKENLVMIGTGRLLFPLLSGQAEKCRIVYGV